MELANQIVKILNKKKAKNIDVLRIDGVSSLADYFIICTGTSGIHVKALADDLCDKLAEADIKPRHIEGCDVSRRSPESMWILLDFGDIVVHIFHEESRMFYNLERLWSDATEVKITSVLEQEVENGI